MIVFDIINKKVVGIDEIKFITTNHFGYIDNRPKSDYSVLNRLSIINESCDDALTVHVKNELLANKSFEEIYTQLNEGLFGSILGGLTGFALGKKVGEIICNVLGVNSGILKDLLTSRLFGAAIGSAIGKNL